MRENSVPDGTDSDLCMEPAGTAALLDRGIALRIEVLRDFFRRPCAGQERLDIRVKHTPYATPVRIVVHEINHDSKAGARSSGILYSIVETAKANGLKVFYYLSYILEELANHPDDQSQEFITRLLPWSDQLPENCYLDLIKKPD